MPWNEKVLHYRPCPHCNLRTRADLQQCFNCGNTMPPPLRLVTISEIIQHQLLASPECAVEDTDPQAA